VAVYIGYNFCCYFLLKLKTLFYDAFCFFFVFSAVIIPTLNLYLESIDASDNFMGICLAAMSITNLLSAPIYGRITDIIRRTKAVVVISNLFAIGGKNFFEGRCF